MRNLVPGNTAPDFLSDRAVAEFRFSRGAVALRAVLTALGVGADDTVILTGFTCVVVAEAVKQLGGTCIYTDMNESDFGTSAAALADLKLDAVPKAVVVQHSFGIPSDMKAIMRWSDQFDIPVIEDCAISLGSTIHGRPIGSFGAAAFWSGQWSKPNPVGRLGVLQLNDEALVPEVTDIWQSAGTEPMLNQLSMALQTPLRRSVLSSSQKARLQRLARRYRRKKRTLKPSEQSFDLDFVKGGKLQYRSWHRQLRYWSSEISHRKRIADFLHEELASFGPFALPADSERDVVFSRFPLRVSNKTELLCMAEEMGVEIGDWMDCPLHEAHDDLTRWDYLPGSCPAGERAAKETINLPVHGRVSTDEARRVADFVRTFATPAR